MGAEASARSRREAIALGVTAEVAEQKQELKGGVRTAQCCLRSRVSDEELLNFVAYRNSYRRSFVFSSEFVFAAWE